MPDKDVVVFENGEIISAQEAELGEVNDYVDPLEGLVGEEVTENE